MNEKFMVGKTDEAKQTKTVYINNIPCTFDSSSANTIRDSGTRTTFDSGAVRDMHDSKGRCDLLPLNVVDKLYGIADAFTSPSSEECIPHYINLYVYTGRTIYLYLAACAFIFKKYGEGNPRCMISQAMLDLSTHYEEGAKKYAARNWEKGIPLHSFIDSGIRHYFKYTLGQKDERHDLAFLWNIFGCIWTHHTHYIKQPELIDLPFCTDIKDGQILNPQTDLDAIMMTNRVNAYTRQCWLEALSGTGEYREKSGDVIAQAGTLSLPAQASQTLATSAYIGRRNLLKDISEPDKMQTDKSFANDKKFIITAAENLHYPQSCINKLNAAKTLGEMNIIMVTARKEREANEKSNV